jgi:hypothetical protein
MTLGKRRPAGFMIRGRHVRADLSVWRIKRLSKLRTATQAQDFSSLSHL